MVYHKDVGCNGHIKKWKGEITAKLATL